MKITLNDVTNIDALSVINDNFDKIEQELQNKVLYRNNPYGEPNSISNDIDMNGNDLLNVGDVVSANGRWATIDEVEAIKDQVEDDAATVAADKAIVLGYRNTAQTAATDAQTAYDNFDDRYLGAKSSDPSVDNDGNLLLTGALYYRTSGTPIMRVYNGTTWQDVGSITTSITNLVDPSLYASQAEAEAGINNTKVMTPLRTKESIAANVITKRWLTGEWVLIASTTAPAGTLTPNGQTIGSAASGATGRANGDTLDLFTVLWNSSSNVDLPIQDSAGSASTRGASAADDFAANKRLPLPNIQDGDALVAAVSSAVLSRTAGQVISHTHAITVDSGGSHSHRIPVGTSEGDAYTVTNGSGTNSDIYTDASGAHSHTASAANTGGAKNLAAGLMTRVYIAL